MAQDLFRYDLLTQDALRGVVRKVLSDAARAGLPGEHHFYISFDTRAPGVRLSQRLREKYPEEMTIVLQHQFWELAVTEHAFEVGLSFGNVPERLLVPFAAVKGFFDPSVQFGLQFDVARDGKERAAEEPAKVAEQVPQEVPAEVPTPKRAGPPAKPERKGARKADKAKEKPAADVVSLDAFRKK